MDRLRIGVSTRGGVSWLRMARARALLTGREFVTPDDLQSLAMPCLAHRVTPQPGVDADGVVTALLREVDVD